MLLGAVFFAIPPFLYLIVENAGALLLLRFVHGFATAIFAPVASAYVVGLGDQARGARLGWLSSANDFGATVGPLIGRMILYATASFAASDLLVGTLGMVALGLALLVPETEAIEAPASHSLAHGYEPAFDAIAAIIAAVAANFAAWVRVAAMPAENPNRP